MNEKTLGLILILAAVAVPFIKLDGIIPRPAPDNTPSVDIPAGLEVILKTGDKSDAMKWSGMIGGLASFIEADGQTSDPMLETMDDVAQLIEAATKAPIEPVSGSQVIGAALGSRLDEIGQAGDPLDTSRRGKVVALFKAAAQVLGGA